MRPTRTYRTIRGSNANYKTSFYATKERRDAAGQRDANKDGQDVLLEEWFPDLDANNDINQGWGMNGVAHPRATCAWCHRTIELSKEDGWIDPEAPATPEDGDDHIWRETCDENDAFDARHEPGTVVVRVTFKCTKCEHKQSLLVVKPVVDRGTGQLTGGFTGSAADFCDDCDGAVEQDGDGLIQVETLEEQDVDLYEVKFVGVR